MLDISLCHKCGVNGGRRVEWLTWHILSVFKCSAWELSFFLEGTREL